MSDAHDMTASRSVRGVAPSFSNPTLRELEVMAAVVNAGSIKGAALAMGLTYDTIKNHLRSLYDRIGAHHRPHAAVILWPVLGEVYCLPDTALRPERRLGHERRAA